MEEELINYLVKKYRKMLQGLAFTYVKNVADAEDIVQDVFVYVLTKNVAFQNEEHERAWLIRTTIHRSINLIHSARRTRIEFKEEIYSTACDSDFANVSAENMYLLEAVLRLPDRYKGIIHLYYYQGYTLEEIAVLLDLPLSTVKTRMVRGRKKLKNLIEEA